MLATNPGLSDEEKVKEQIKLIDLHQTIPTLGDLRNQLEQDSEIKIVISAKHLEVKIDQAFTSCAKIASEHYEILQMIKEIFTQAADPSITAEKKQSLINEAKHLAGVKPTLRDVDDAVHRILDEIFKGHHELYHKFGDMRASKEKLIQEAIAAEPD